MIASSPDPFRRALAISPFLVVGLLAQQPAGLLAGMPPTGVQLTALAIAGGAEMMARIPGETYRGIGEFVSPASHRIRGVVVHLRDATPVDGESFDLHVYLEQGLSNRPTITGTQSPGTTAVVSVTDLATPPGLTEHRVEVVFAAPLDVPIGSDLFIGIVPDSSNLALRVLGGTSVPNVLSSAFDACGPALPLGVSYVLLHDAPVLEELTSGTIGWQGMVDVLVDGPSGVGTSQIDGSGVATASLFSGVHPDVADPSHHTARHDVPGYRFYGNGTVPAASLVLLIGSSEPFAGGPFLVIQPGNAVLHVRAAGAFVLAAAITDPSGEAEMPWPVPQAPALRGLDVTTQAFAFDVGAGEVRAGAAVRQRF